jgi:hypothetical protein
MGAVTLVIGRSQREMEPPHRLQLPPLQQPTLLAAARDARPSLPLAQLPLKVLSIETGEVLKDFKQLIKRGESIVVIEQFNQKLLIKQVCS